VAAPAFFLQPESFVRKCGALVTLGGLGERRLSAASSSAVALVGRDAIIPPM